MSKTRYQINNLTVKYNRDSEKWEVWTPTGDLWEEFEGEQSAILFAEDTNDLLTEHGRKRKYGW